MDKTEFYKNFYGWPNSYKKATINRAAKALTFLGRDDNYISNNCRAYDNCFEMGDGSLVVELIKLASKNVPDVKYRLEHSRFANPEWKG